MSSSTERGLWLALLLILQLSFSSLLFSGSLSLHVLTALALSLSFTLGFQRSFLPLILLGLGYDALSYGRPGLTAAILTLTAYAGSFVSRRFLVGHSVSRVWVIGFFGAGAALAEGLLSPLLLQAWSPAGLSWRPLADLFPGWGSLAATLFGNALLAVAVFFLWARLEARWSMNAPLRLSR